MNEPVLLTFTKSPGAIKIWKQTNVEKPNNSSWIKKEVLRGPFGNFEVLNGLVL